MASTKRDYYEVLGLSKQATTDEIKRAFRRLAMQYHPDRNKEPGAESKFKEVNEAYEVLRDDQKRKIYDTYGHDGLNQQGFHSSNAQDIFNQFFGGGGGGVKFSFGGDDDDPFTDIFGNMFGQGRRQSRSRQTMDQPYEIDIRFSINIKFIESVVGSIHTLKYKIKTTCDQCNGTGAESKNDIKTCSTCGGQGVVITKHRTILGVMQSQEVCPTCHGSGKIITKPCSKCHGKKFLEKEIQFDLTIPPGVTNGTTYKVEGKGNVWNNRSGTLLLDIYVTPSKIFTRKGDVIYTKVPIDPMIAMIGGTVKIPTPYGIKDVEIHAQTSVGDELTISGHGIKNIKKKMFHANGINGDLVVVFEYAKPKHYSRDEIEKLKNINNTPNPYVEQYEKMISKEIK